MVCILTVRVQLHKRRRDFNAPPAGRPADSSAAMIVANGLLLLGQLDTETTRRPTWITAAIQVCLSLRPKTSTNSAVVDHFEHDSISLGPCVAKSALERDGEQASGQLLDRHCLW